MRRLLCWWRAIRYGQWGEIYGGHTVDEIQKFTSTGVIFHEEVCTTCGMSFGFRR